MSIPITQFITPPSPPPHRFPCLVSIRLFSTSVSHFLPCKLVHLYHFSRFHIYALIYDICFSLSDLLHSVWQSPDPSKSLQMTQFRLGVIFKEGCFVLCTCCFHSWECNFCLKKVLIFLQICLSLITSFIRLYTHVIFDGHLSEQKMLPP